MESSFDIGGIFSVTSYLSLCRLHNESRCGRLRSLSCRTCGAKFSTEDELDEHKIVHTKLGGKQNIGAWTKQWKRKDPSDSEQNDSVTPERGVFNDNMTIANGGSDQEEIKIDTNEIIIDGTVLENR